MSTLLTGGELIDRVCTEYNMHVLYICTTHTQGEVPYVGTVLHMPNNSLTFGFDFEAYIREGLSLVRIRLRHSPT